MENDLFRKYWTRNHSLNATHFDSSISILFENDLFRKYWTRNRPLEMEREQIEPKGGGGVSPSDHQKLNRWNGGGGRHNGRRARGSPGSLAWRIISDPRLPPLLFLFFLFFPSNERNARTRSTTSEDRAERKEELNWMPRNLRFVVPSRWLETYPPSKQRRVPRRPPFLDSGANYISPKYTYHRIERSFIPRRRKILLRERAN